MKKLIMIMMMMMMMMMMQISTMKKKIVMEGKKKKRTQSNLNVHLTMMTIKWRNGLMKMTWKRQGVGKL